MSLAERQREVPIGWEARALRSYVWCPCLIVPPSRSFLDSIRNFRTSMMFLSFLTSVNLNLRAPLEENLTHAACLFCLLFVHVQLWRSLSDLPCGSLVGRVSGISKISTGSLRLGAFLYYNPPWRKKKSSERKLPKRSSFFSHCSRFLLLWENSTDYITTIGEMQQAKPRKRLIRWIPILIFFLVPPSCFFT